jgi:multiple sugar transport system permease protein
MSIEEGRRMSTLRHVLISTRLGRRKGRAERQAFWAFIGFTAPLIIGLILFIVVPIVWGFLISFCEAKGTVVIRNFVGVSNYNWLFTDPAFISSLKTVAVFAFLIVPGTFAFSLGLALLVNNIRRAQGFFRAVFFLPIACSYVLASMVWRMAIFNGMRYGFANVFLNLFGVAPIAWTSSSPEVWLVLVTVRLWIQAGFYVILFIAGIQEIPRELYDAARVDGAERGWPIFWRITFPLLRNTSLFVLFMNIVNAFQAFDEFYNILAGTYATMQSGGGNVFLARPPLVYLYMTSFQAQDYGRGTSGAFVVAACIIIVTLIQGRLLGFGRGVRE